MPAHPDPRPTSSTPNSAPSARRWLLFVHQLPASPSNLRVRAWRRLQQIGAIPIKQAVYVLPDVPSAREDFEWLKAEIKSAGGDATVFTASTVDTWADDAMAEEFRRLRQDAYFALADEIERVHTRLEVKRRPRGTRRPSVGRLVEGFRARLVALEQTDFFGSAGRDRVVSLLAKLSDRGYPGRSASRQREPTDPADRAAYAGRLWVTRPRPGVDRMGSAWLIRRFIDPGARFGFAADREALPTGDVIPFDMFGVDFSHQGEGCTFETLCGVFGIDDMAVHRIAEIVHDLDLRDGRFGAPEAGTVAALIDGMQRATADDDVLLERGITVFESLYLAFADAARPLGPRVAASAATSATRPLPSKAKGRHTR